MTDLHRAVEILRSGGLVAFATETVYGLGADATNAGAVARIFAAKGRPPTNPLIVHIADEQAGRRFTSNWPAEASKLAQAFWPGPLTLVLPKSDAIVQAVTAGRPTVGLRVPNHPLALALLVAFDGPIAAPSANRSNHISPTNAQHVRDELGDAVDLVLDGGPCQVGIESTVLDLSSETPTILRPGQVSKEQIESVLRSEVHEHRFIIESSTAASSPGQQPVHYAPRTPAIRFETSQRGLIQPRFGAQSNGIMAVGTIDFVHKWGPIVAMPKIPEVYARHFYEVLRELDNMNLHTIYIEVPPNTPAWSAIRDRIMRATQPHP